VATEAKVKCANCDEPLLVTYVLVRKPSRDKTSHECPVCGDPESVSGVLEKARSEAASRRPLLLSVRSNLH
jgi:hypothetical protein